MDLKTWKMKYSVLFLLFFSFFIIVFLLFICLGFHVKAVHYSPVNFAEFDRFKQQYGKTYIDKTEDEFRMNIYKENRDLIVKHNQMYDKGLVTYTMAMNQFGDLLSSEYVDRLKSYTTFNNLQLLGSLHFNKLSRVHPPDRLDWRTKGYVTPAVKDQGDCNAGYAFASIGALEGQQFKKTGQLVSLSAQAIVDCSVNDGNRGCKGGNTTASYQSVYYHGGVASEESYPYTGKEDKCKKQIYKRFAGIVITGKVFPPNEEDLQKVLTFNGPLAVTVDAAHDSFRFYSGGVYYEELCSTTDLIHSMLVVGYDTDDNGGDYWIVKNSWGEGWGEKGYIKMARNRKNNCGIASDATTPMLAGVRIPI